MEGSLMSDAVVPGPQLDMSDDDLRELLSLLREVDSAELKLTIPQADHASTLQALDLDPLNAQIRQVFFFDTPDLRLDAAGVVVRARRVQGKGDDTVVKLRPVGPSQLPRELRELPDFGVEVDAMPHGKHVCSASFKGTAKKVRETVSAGGTYRKLFTKRQRAFFAQHAPEGLELDDLAVLGPIFVLKAKFEPKVLGRRMVAELWLYPSGDRVLELSTKCPPLEAVQTAMEARQFLNGKGIDIGGEQQTKTRTALAYFSSQLG
jgi:hypothetical protein